MLEIVLVIVLILLVTGGISYPRYTTTPDNGLHFLIWLLVALVVIGLVLRLTGVWVI